MIIRQRQAFLQRLFRQNEFAMKLGLDAMRQALQRCGDPHRQHRRIVVAGTNGKGSVASCIHAILCQLGEKSGLFTSPHLVDFSERIRINGRPIDDQTLLRIGPRVLARFGGAAATPSTNSTAPEDDGIWRQLLDEEVEPEEVALTYFELATLMAVLAFQDAGVTTGVYEVGLGGRLDATNALDPTVSVVTSIGLDHQKWLGDTLEEIAAEKAGIFRKGRPAVIGSRTATDVLLSIAEELGAAPILTLGRDYQHKKGTRGRVIEIQHPEEKSPWSCTVPGARPHWAWDNVATAVAAAHVHRDQALSRKHAVEGVMRTRWPGRLQLLELANGRTVLLDAAHNPPAADALLSAWPELAQGRPAVILYGTMGDKDVENVTRSLGALPGLAAAVVAPVNNARAASGEEIAARAHPGFKEKVTAVATSVPDGIKRALEVAPAGAMLLVTGSIYLLGEAVTVLGVEDTLESTIAPGADH